jgi:hypothetical protein
MITDEIRLREQAKLHILKTNKIMREFPNYPTSWLNKVICFRYNLSDPLEKQIRDYISHEKKNQTKEQKFDIIVVK